MKNLSIKSSLLLLVSMLLTLLLLSVSATVLRMQSGQQQVASLYQERVLPMVRLKRVADGYALGVVDVAQKTRDGLLRPDEAAKRVAQARADIAAEWKTYVSTTMTEQEAEMVQATERLMQQADPVLSRLQQLLERQQMQELWLFTSSEMFPVVEPLLRAIDGLTALQVDAVQQVYEDSQRSHGAALIRNLVGAAVGVLLSVCLSWLLIRTVTRGLASAVLVAQRAAEGDLGQHIPVHGRNEIAQLMASMARMTHSLSDIVGQVRQSADQIATGSTQIAGGNADLSQRTEAQASNLEETAASMEELTATVKQNAHTAALAAELAGDAARMAKQGGAVVQQVVDTMDHISERSRRIADIVGTIDGIAFQTNILALNAAVEAARAGEQGRGFAVVAGEVRTLAQRSAEAAKEIAKLISDSVDTVSRGNVLVQHAGENMSGIVAQVHRVSGLVQEISAASAEQTLGIEQVGQAVMQLDQATQQNAALVEESAAAAESLRQQGHHLTQLVGTFRLAS